MSPFLAFALILFLIILGYSLRVIKEFERAVVYTLGRFSGVQGPGMIMIIPFIQIISRVDMRVRRIIVEEDVHSGDNQPLRLSAEVFFQVKNPDKAINNVPDYMVAVTGLTRTAMREKTRSRAREEILGGIESLSSEICGALDAQTAAWGIAVSSVVLRHSIGAAIPVNQPA